MVLFLLLGVVAVPGNMFRKRNVCDRIFVSNTMSTLYNHGSTIYNICFNYVYIIWTQRFVLL